jgi:hypothetical protein
VAGGDSIASVEVVDLESSKSVCSNMMNLPQSKFAPFGGITGNLKPFVCGGRLGSNDCFTYDRGEWQPTFQLNEPRYNSAITESPFLYKSSWCQFHKHFPVVI